MSASKALTKAEPTPETWLSRTRTEARARGMAVFTSLRSCPVRGHGYVRLVTNGKCRDCVAAPKLKPETPEQAKARKARIKAAEAKEVAKEAAREAKAAARAEAAAERKRERTAAKRRATNEAKQVAARAPEGSPSSCVSSLEATPQGVPAGATNEAPALAPWD
jgi:hypothetical protein